MDLSEHMIEVFPALQFVSGSVGVPEDRQQYLDLYELVSLRIRAYSCRIPSTSGTDPGIQVCDWKWTGDIQHSHNQALCFKDE